MIRFGSFLILVSLSISRAQDSLPFQNPRLPVEQRVQDLVSRMTLADKISQMQHTAAAIPHLGIPEYNWWNEALHGVARAGTATVFPQAIGLAATWDTGLLHRVAEVISIEARAKHHEFVRRGKRGMYQGLTFWSPNINIFRDPRWGRGQETFGEDPYLTGQMGLAFVRGLQGDDPRYLRTVATPKHFAIHSGPESDRHSFDARISEYDLRETYLPAFETCIRDGGAFSTMCAYNRFDGEPCCSNSLLLTTILRGEWKFSGYVVSDCGAIFDIHNGHQTVTTAAEAAARAVSAGCDLSCGPEYAALAEAVQRGLISETEIDRAVSRLFTARFRLGLFDPPEMVPYARIPYTVNDSFEHDQLSLETARESIVLLKNNGPLLPLSKSLRRIAVIGPNADDVEVLLGNYNGTPSNPVTPLQGIRDKLGPGVEIRHALGCDWADKMPSLRPVPASVLFTKRSAARKPGLQAEYYDHRDFTGAPLISRIEPQIDGHWHEGSPDARLDPDHFAIRWSGSIIPTQEGRHYLGGYGFNEFRIYLEDSLLVQFNGKHHPNKIYRPVYFEKNRAYSLRVEFIHRMGDAQMQLIWAEPGNQLEEEAVEAAAGADAVILCMGLSPRLEGEEMDVAVEGFHGGDRLTLDLPQAQERLVRRIGRMDKPVVLLLLSGSAVAVNWADQHIPAILQAWYPGQRAGTAIADVLFGDYNPGGRLPITYYKSEADLPPFTDYRMNNRTYRYFTGEPLYPFGYGLSYTTFQYSDLALKNSAAVAGQAVALSFVVKNTGSRAGDEVAQIYLTRENAPSPSPNSCLAGFERIHLKSGEEKKLEFTLQPRQLSAIDNQGERTIEPGWFTLSVGGLGSRSFLSADADQPPILKGRFELTGVRVPCP